MAGIRMPGVMLGPSNTVMIKPRRVLSTQSLKPKGENAYKQENKPTNKYKL